METTVLEQQLQNKKYEYSFAILSFRWKEKRNVFKVFCFFF